MVGSYNYSGFRIITLANPGYARKILSKKLLLFPQQVIMSLKIDIHTYQVLLFFGTDFANFRNLIF